MFNAFSKKSKNTFNASLNVFVKSQCTYVQYPTGFCYNRTSSSTYSMILLVLLGVAPNYFTTSARVHACKTTGGTKTHTLRRTIIMSRFPPAFRSAPASHLRVVKDFPHVRESATQSWTSKPYLRPKAKA